MTRGRPAWKLTFSARGAEVDHLFFLMEQPGNPQLLRKLSITTPEGRSNPKVRLFGILLLTGPSHFGALISGKTIKAGNKKRQ